MSRIRRAVLAVLVAVACAAGLTVTTTPAADASAYGNVYLVVGNWNCVGGGSVTGIFGSVDNVWTGGDWGDNIIYPRVALYRTNTFNGWAYCSRPWWQRWEGSGYWINVTWWQFYPARTGQTFWY